ncbi:hypothetical protein ACTXT7_003832 [Hymenolepis weldensis]
MFPGKPEKYNFIVLLQKKSGNSQIIGSPFVAHSNCQHQLENTFYGNMFCIRDFEGWQRLQFFLIFTPLLPILYIIYLFIPNLKHFTWYYFFSDESIKRSVNNDN